MIYAVMISLEAGVLAPESFIEGKVAPRVRDQVLSMIQTTLLSCEDLGGPKAHRLDFRSFHAAVERVGFVPDHVDRVVIKPDGIFAKIEIPAENAENWQWGGLKVLVEKEEP